MWEAPAPVRADIQQVLEGYPRIFFACHTRHRRDPKTRRRLSAHQASVLDHLDDVEPTNLMDLARHMGVTPSTMSLSVERLVRRGYVLRARDPRDRRRLRLRLSPAGVRIKEAQQVLEPDRVRGMLDRLALAERAEALRGLALLARAAGEYLAGGPPKRVGLRRRVRRV
jgi:DNA-binding MarR family transcriptional regulator